MYTLPQTSCSEFDPVGRRQRKPFSPTEGTVQPGKPVSIRIFGIFEIISGIYLPRSSDAALQTISPPTALASCRQPQSSSLGNETNAIPVPATLRVAFATLVADSGLALCCRVGNIEDSSRQVQRIFLLIGRCKHPHRYPRCLLITPPNHPAEKGPGDFASSNPKQCLSYR